MTIDFAAPLATDAPESKKTPSRPARSSVVGRVAAMIWFALLAIVYARFFGFALNRALQDAHAPLAWASVLTVGCTGLFYGILGWLMITRPAPRASTGAVPTLVALVGTYGVWLTIFLPQVEASPLRAVLGAALTVVGSMLIIVSIAHLGRAFSISPQARKLVTTGPYALVRNPLYLAEEIAVAGVLMQFVWWAAICFFTVHAAIQVRRILYEEAILRGAFPDYEAYARRTARLIPGIW